jgi:hypothetical protein
MTGVIWKYALPFSAVEVQLPAGTRVLTMQNQGGVPTLWALVDPDASPVRRRFVVCGTGHAGVDPDWTYLGTDQFPGGIVAHAFEVPAS